MIIQTGLRTDIPAFYSQWLCSRLKEGSVCVRNPYNPSSVTRYSLSPQVVDLVAFCTKNPAPMLSRLDLLAPYGQYWFVTITPYGKDIEPNVPDKEQVLQDFRTLSSLVGVDSVGWRYDPIFLSADYPLQRHLEEFSRMAEILEGSTRTCVISFIDLYQKVRRNFPEAREVPPTERIALGRAFGEIGKKRGMAVKACAEGKELSPYGIDCGGCMTAATYEAALGRPLAVPKVNSSRSQCGCLMGSDIGQYDTCPHLCRYCYANSDPGAVRRNQQRHDPESPFLVGGFLPGDQVRQADQASWLDPQLRLF